MKVVSFYKSLPIKDPESFFDLTADPPRPGPRDLLVEVRAISVNPVDTKIRAGGGPGKPQGELVILGWDAAGVVREVGTEVRLFKPGDEVYYAGALDRPGSYAEIQCVDERIVGKKPKNLDFAAAAALPLTAITAWESLFDRLRLDKSAHESLLIVGGAGGVGSIAIQLAKQLTHLKIIATASRPETQDWCRRMGAQHVINHGKPLASQVKAIVGWRRQIRARAHSNGRSFRRINRGDGAAKRHCVDREPGTSTRYHQAKAKKHIAPLGVHVHPIALSDA
jgi:NADPH2:quinone reductase